MRCTRSISQTDSRVILGALRELQQLTELDDDCQACALTVLWNVELVLLSRTRLTRALTDMLTNDRKMSVKCKSGCYPV
jgi:hypothetical protein